MKIINTKSTKRISFGQYPRNEIRIGFDKYYQKLFVTRNGKGITLRKINYHFFDFNISNIYKYIQLSFPFFQIRIDW